MEDRIKDFLHAFDEAVHSVVNHTIDLIDGKNIPPVDVHKESDESKNGTGAPSDIPAMESAINPVSEKQNQNADAADFEERLKAALEMLKGGSKHE